MPVFNGEHYLRETVESILNQSWRDFEFIVIDDGSTDESAKILDPYNDPRIVRETFKANRGLVAALNRGLEVARGRYIARHDADDVAIPQRLKRQVEFLDTHVDIAIAGSAYIEIDETGKQRKKIRMPEDVLALRWHSLFQNPFIHSTVMFRRATVMEMGGYAFTTAASHVEDYALWLRMMWSGQGMANMSEPLVQWRANSQGVSRTFASQQDENFRATVRANLWNCAPSLRNDDPLTDLVWRLQVCGGFDLPLEEVEKALNVLEELVKNFCDYFDLDDRQRRLVRQLALRRTAGSLLHNAQQYAYAGRSDDANELARLAIDRDKRLALTSDYRRFVVRNMLGQQSTQRLRDAQKRIKSAIHLS
jgi:glycosyltransferase involved in cell wall biosynthesis